jgi:hypothetical protein
MLRVKVVRLSKNIEETSTWSLNIVEGKCRRSLEGESEENPKSYEEVIKGYIKKEECNPLKKNISKGHKTQEEEYKRNGHQRIPFTFIQPRSFTHNEGVNKIEDHDQPKHDFKRTIAQRRSSTPRYVNLFYGHFFYCTNFGHKVANCRTYGRNVQVRNDYVAPHNIECYKCQNYGHIAHNCKSTKIPSMKREIDILYTKILEMKRKRESE